MTRGGRRELWKEGRLGETERREEKNKWKKKRIKGLEGNEDKKVRVVDKGRE